jgi:hypothetical protein
MSKEYTAFNGHAFWNDGYVQELDTTEKAVYFHYITSPFLENSGVFKEGRRMAAFYVGIDIDTMKNAEEKLEKDGKIYRVGEWVIVPSSLKHQHFGNATSNTVKGMYEQLKTVPAKVLSRLRRCDYALDLSPVLSPEKSDTTKTAAAKRGRGRPPAAKSVAAEPEPATPVVSDTTEAVAAIPVAVAIEPLPNPSGTPTLYSDSDLNRDKELELREEREEPDSKQADAPEDAPLSFSEKVFSENLEKPEEPAQPEPSQKIKADKPAQAWFNRQNPSATPPPLNALTPGLNDAATWFDEIRIYWNETMRELRQFWSRNAAQLDYDAREIMLAAYSAFPDTAVVKRAIDNYRAVLSDPEKYDPAGSVYKNLVRFIKAGIDNYCDDVAPLEHCLSAGYKKQREEEERKCRNDERTLAMIRKTREKQESVA